MSKEYKIRCISDIAALTADQQERFLVDFAAWLKFVRAFEDEAPEQIRGSIASVRSIMTWVDDHKQGECSGFDLQVRIAKDDMK